MKNLTQRHIPHGQPCFHVRDISDNYDGPTFDVAFLHPTTWRCHYIGDEGMFGTLEEAVELCDRLNREGWSDDLDLQDMDDDNYGAIRGVVARLVAQAQHKPL